MVDDQTPADDRFLAFSLLLLGALAVLAAAAYGVLTSRQNQPAIVAAGNFGAVAMSTNSFDVGSAWGYGDAASAARRAISECNAHTPHGNCVLRLNLNGNCGALAISTIRGQSFAATDSDKTLASALALAQCQSEGAIDCRVRQAFCGDGT